MPRASQNPIGSGFFPHEYEDFNPKTHKNTLSPLVSSGSILGEHAQGRDQNRRSDLATLDFENTRQRGGKVHHGKQRQKIGVDTKGGDPIEFQPRDTQQRQNFGVDTFGEIFMDELDNLDLCLDHGESRYGAFEKSVVYENPTSLRYHCLLPVWVPLP